MAEPQTALAGHGATDTYIGIGDAGPVGQVTVKGDLATAALRDAVASVADPEMPRPLSVTGNGTGTRIVWMAPDEVLLLSGRYGDGAAWAASLSDQLGPEGAIATNVSDARTLIRLTGPRVSEVLAKGAPCDVSEQAFPIGTARRTHIAGLAVAFWRLEPEMWEIVCLRSYAHHLMEWLTINARTGTEL